MENLWTEIDAYFERNLLPVNEAFLAALKRQNESGLPSINVTPLQGKMLNLLVKITGAKRILEIGLLGGYSAMWMASGLPPGGSLLSLEISEKHAEVATENIRNAGLLERVEIRVGNAVDLLSGLRKGEFDLIFIDADKQSIPHYYQKARELCRKGGTIVIDNVVRRGEVIDENNTDSAVVGVRNLVSLLKQENAEATVIQTVGDKGHDGFMLIRV